MKKRFSVFVLFCCFLLINNTQAQQTESLIGKVIYNFIHKYDKSDTTKVFNTNVLLLIGKTNSRFANAKYNDTDPIPDFVSMPKIKPDGIQKPVEVRRPRAKIVLNSKAIGTEFWYRIPQSNKLVLIGMLGYKDYRIESSLPTIEWAMSSDTRKIGNFICQKATCNFGGRNYTAWFAPDLAFSYGPWKLGGLPGLILEAADEKNEVSFIFKEFAFSENEYLHFEELRPIILSEEKYLKEKDKFERDPITLSKAQLSSDTEFTRITFEDTMGKIVRDAEAIEAIKIDSKIQITNPLMLSKKK